MQWKDYEGNGMGNRMIRENLEHVKANIKRACEGSGRKEEDVTLIAVSKTKPLPMLMDAAAGTLERIKCRSLWTSGSRCRKTSAGT